MRVGVHKSMKRTGIPARRDACPPFFQRAARLIGLLAASACVLAPGAGRVLAAGTGEVQLDRLQVGFQGAYKVGEWAPVRLVATSASAHSVRLIVAAPDADDNAVNFVSAAVALRAGEATQIEGKFRTGRLNGEIEIRLEEAPSRGVLVERRLRPSRDPELPPGLRLDASLWLTLADLPGMSAPAPAARSDAAGTEPVVVRLESLSELPREMESWQPVDLLLVAASRRGESGRTLVESITSEQSDQLHAWVRGGGHLLVSLGADVAAYEASPLARWVPLKVEGESALRKVSNLDAFSATSIPLKFTGSIKVARLGALPPQNVLVRETAGPLAAAVPVGFGRVTFLGFDVDREPFASWKGLPSVLKRLAMGRGRRGERETQRSNRQLAQVGVSDLATQFHAAQEKFESVRRPSYWWVMGLILLYVAVIGPLDYLLVHRWLGRARLTWATFPLLVGGVIVLAVWAAGNANGKKVLVSQLDLVDIDGQSGSVRARSWVSLYSPQNRRFDVALEPRGKSSADSEKAKEGVGLVWSGVPENAVGGLYRLGASGLSDRAYSFNEEGNSVANLPVPQWSTRTLTAGWSETVSAAVIESHLESAGEGQLSGTLVHRLPEPLEECVLVVGGWSFTPVFGDAGATLPPNLVWQPAGPNGRQRHLKSLLTGERQTRRQKNSYTTEILVTSEPWDPFNHDRDDQMAMLTFHEIAGGSEHTSLGHAALRSLELTSLVDLGRGVLIGRVRRPAARVTIEGQPATPDEQHAFVRFVLPVGQPGRSTALAQPAPSEKPPGT